MLARPSPNGKRSRGAMQFQRRFVAVLIPAVRAWARERSTAPSRLLMPLSFASVLGGACTLVGTSSNLVIHGMLLDAGDVGFGVFELAWVAMPVAVVGVIYCHFAASPAWDA